MTTMTRKRWIAPIFLTIGFVAGTSPATAATTLPPAPNYPDQFILQDFVNSDCPDFDVTAQLTGKSGFIELPGGRTIGISPGTTITLTGPTGTTVRYVITGSVDTVTNPDDGTQEVRSIGRNLLIVPNANGHPEGLYLTTGNVNYALDSKGSELRLFSGPGRVVDVCKVLEP